LKSSYESEYNNFSRVTKQTEPDGSVTQKEYHGLTTVVINPLGQRTTQVKDVAGNLVKSEDSQGKAVTSIYDGFNEMRDSLGNMTQMSYDQRGNKTRLDDPDTHVTTYTYNVLGELLSQTDAKTQTVTFRYDLLGRLVERQEPEGTTTWEYDTASMGIGSLAKLTSSSGYSETYRYDSFGRATETLTAFGGQILPVTTCYDQYGRTAALTYPTSFAVRHVYNEFGYLQAVHRADNQQSVWKAETMNARGQLEKLSLGNGLITQRTYDPLTGHLQTIKIGYDK
jgi:YD repeat-containing protein